LREEVAQERAAFREEVSRIRLEDLVFVDESGINTAMTRLYGRAPEGERALGRAPAGRWRQLTILGGLSVQGLIACMSIEAATDTPVFVAFVREILVPALKPGQVVILDNLSPHKADEVRELIEGAGCRLRLLPPYSPDLNPIEQTWSKLKALLRSAAARTKEALEEALTAVIEQITAADARGWFAHCGYKPTLS
jgi:transposase